MIPVVCFVGPSGVGKTTLLERVAAGLRGRGLGVAFIKHAVHGFEMDREGKDSWRLARAGCNPVVVASSRRVAFIQEREGEASLEELVKMLPGHVDIALAEGFKGSSKPRVEVFRSQVCESLFSRPEQLLAIVCDREMPVDVPQFGFDEVDSLVGLIVDTQLSGGRRAVDKKV